MDSVDLIYCPPSMVVARSYSTWPWSSSQMKAGRDPTMAKFEGRQLVHLILAKGGLRLQSFWSRRHGGLGDDLSPAILVVLVL